MKINIKATGIELTQAISDYAEKKVLSLEKYFKHSTDSRLAQVELAKTTNHHKEGEIFRAEVHITGGMDIYAAKEAEDLYAAIDMMEAEAARELQSNKGKKMHLLRRGQRAFKDAVRGISDRFRRE